MDKELKKGIRNLNKVLKTKKDVFEAFISNSLGKISLIYGFEGNANNNFKKGYGISHIVAKRNYEAKNSTDNKEKGVDVAKKLIDVIINGEIVKTIKSKETVHIEKDGYEAVLSLDWHKNKITWLLTGYKIKKD